MKTTFPLLFLFLFPTVIFSQDWTTNWDDALQMAAQDDKKIILVFSGSDWCAPCIKLEKEVWETNFFKDYAAAHYVMVRADFPKRKKNALPKAQQNHNDQLAARYNPNGYFPFIVILDKHETILGQTGYQKKSPEEFVTMLNAF